MNIAYLCRLRSYEVHLGGRPDSVAHIDLAHKPPGKTNVGVLAAEAGSGKHFAEYIVDP